MHLSVLAIGAAQLKQWEEASKRLIDAINQVEALGERWYEAELYRLKGEFLLAQHPKAAAEQAAGCFLQSLEIARVQNAKLWELRTSMSLAKLRLTQGSVHEARNLLAPIYAEFTEGFETKDLVEARNLTDKLGGLPH